MAYCWLYCRPTWDPAGKENGSACRILIGYWDYFGKNSKAETILLCRFQLCCSSQNIIHIQVVAYCHRHPKSDAYLILVLTATPYWYIIPCEEVYYLLANNRDINEAKAIALKVMFCDFCLLVITQRHNKRSTATEWLLFILRGHYWKWKMESRIREAVVEIKSVSVDCLHPFSWEWCLCWDAVPKYLKPLLSSPSSEQCPLRCFVTLSVE